MPQTSCGLWEKPHVARSVWSVGYFKALTRRSAGYIQVRDVCWQCGYMLYGGAAVKAAVKARAASRSLFRLSVLHCTRSNALNLSNADNWASILGVGKGPVRCGCILSFVFVLPNGKYLGARASFFREVHVLPSVVAFHAENVVWMRAVASWFIPDVNESMPPKTLGETRYLSSGCSIAFGVLGRKIQPKTGLVRTGCSEGQLLAWTQLPCASVHSVFRRRWKKSGKPEWAMAHTRFVALLLSLLLLPTLNQKHGALSTPWACCTAHCSCVQGNHVHAERVWQDVAQL